MIDYSSEHSNVISVLREVTRGERNLADLGDDTREVASESREFGLHRGFGARLCVHHSRSRCHLTLVLCRAETGPDSISIRTQMDNPDTLFSLATRLDNATLQTLSRSEYWPTIARFAKTNVFWYERVRALVKSDLTIAPKTDTNDCLRLFDSGERAQGECWKRAYYTLLAVLGTGPRPLSGFYDSGSALEDTLALEVVLEVDPPRTWQQAYYAALKCAELGYADSLALILSRRFFRPGRENNKLFRTAAKYGRSDVVRLLLTRRGIDPTAEDNVSLEYAIGAYYTGKSYTLRDGIAPTDSDYLKTARLLLQNERVVASADRARLLWMATKVRKASFIELLQG